MTYATDFVNICLLGVGVYLVIRVLLSKRSSPLPPGPVGWPVIGNLFEIPSEKHWEYCTTLGKKYGMHIPPSQHPLIQTLLSYSRRHFFRDRVGDALCHSQLVQGYIGDSREAEHQML